MSEVWKVEVLVSQLCLTLVIPWTAACSGSSVQGISQARILEWVAIPFSRESSQSRDQTWVSCISGRFFTIWTTRKACQKTWELKLPLITSLLSEAIRSNSYLPQVLVPNAKSLCVGGMVY